LAGVRSKRGGGEDVAVAGCYRVGGGTRQVESEFGAVAVGELIGWASGADLSLWSSTLSLFFAPNARNVPTFDKRCAVEGLGAGRKCPPDYDLEPAGFGTAEPLVEKMFPRFPITDVTPRDDGWIYQIVAALKICSSVSEGDCRSSVDLLTWQGQVGAILRGLREVDVLFVIDGSESMESYFVPVLDAATAFSSELSARGVKARFAAAVYSDYLGQNGTPNEVSYKVISDFGRVADVSGLRNLARTRAVKRQVKDGHRDKPEGPFAALARLAVGDLWLPWARLRGCNW